MRAAVRVHETVAGWDVARPTVPSRLPGVDLAGFRSRGAEPVDVRVVPHPALSLALECGNGPLVVDTATGRRQRGNLAVGFMDGTLRVRGTGVECVQVRLSPVLAQAVLGVSPAELDRGAVALDELWGGDAERVRQRLADAGSWRERFALTEALLAARAHAARFPVEPQVARVWDRIVGSRGRARVEELAAEVGWTRKRLWSRFRSQIGLPPKRAATLVRFDRAAHRLAAGEEAAAVAADGGYADQSHLCREVREFTGATASAVAGGEWLAVDGLAWAKGPAASAS